MSDYTVAVKYAMIFFMITMLIEWVASKVMKEKVYNLSDTISSISSGMTNNIKNKVNICVLFIINFQYKYIINFSYFYLVFICVCIFGTSVEF